MLPHIPDSLNYVADFESGNICKVSAWMLHKTKLENVLKELEFTPEIDMFASRINHQFLKYVSYRPGPQASAIDALSLWNF